MTTMILPKGSLTTFTKSTVVGGSVIPSFTTYFPFLFLSIQRHGRRREPPYATTTTTNNRKQNTTTLQNPRRR